LPIGRDYLLKKTAGPSKPKLFLDTQIVPLAVDAAHSLEVALNRASVRSGVRPAVLVAGLGSLVSLGVVQWLRHRRAADRPS